MKKTLWSSVVFLLLAVPLAAEVPSMRGYWYNRDTAEMFVIDTDADGTVKGTGVYYAKGKGKEAEVKIDPATRRISFNLPPFGNVRARIGRAMNWQLEILDAKNAPKHTLDQMTD